MNFFEWKLKVNDKLEELSVIKPICAIRDQHKIHTSLDNIFNINANNLNLAYN